LLFIEKTRRNLAITHFGKRMVNGTFIHLVIPRHKYSVIFKKLRHWRHWLVKQREYIWKRQVDVQQLHLLLAGLETLKMEVILNCLRVPSRYAGWIAYNGDEP
jgi:hypothetical protein